MFRLQYKMPTSGEIKIPNKRNYLNNNFSLLHICTAPTSNRTVCLSSGFFKFPLKESSIFLFFYFSNTQILAISRFQLQGKSRKSLISSGLQNVCLSNFDVWVGGGGATHQTPLQYAPISEKLIVPQLPRNPRTRRFITVFTTARNLS